MHRNSASKQYSSLSVSAQVEDSTPERLIFLLLEKSVISLRRAALILDTKSMSKGSDAQTRISKTEEYYSSTSKAIQIISALRGCLDLESGGDMARTLDDTYQLILKSTWQAVKTKDARALEKMALALSELQEAWDIVSKKDVVIEDAARIL